MDLILDALEDDSITVGMSSGPPTSLSSHSSSSHQHGVGHGHGHGHGHNYGLGHGYGQTTGHGGMGDDTSGGNEGGGQGWVFKIVTTKRTLVLSAPSEAEEIKWLSTVRALIARRTGNGNTVGVGSGSGSGEAQE